MTTAGDGGAKPSDRPGRSLAIGITEMSIDSSHRAGRSDRFRNKIIDFADAAETE